MLTLSCSVHVGSSAPNSDRTWVPCIGSAESYPLNHQGSPLPALFLFFFLAFYSCIYLAASGLSCGARALSMWDLSSLTRDRTCVPWIGRRILNHWTTGEFPCPVSFYPAHGHVGWPPRVVQRAALYPCHILHVCRLPWDCKREACGLVQCHQLLPRAARRVRSKGSSFSTSLTSQCNPQGLVSTGQQNRWKLIPKVIVSSFNLQFLYWMSLQIYVCVCIYIYIYLYIYLYISISISIYILFGHTVQPVGS